MAEIDDLSDVVSNAFHGTERERARLIEKEGFTPSEGDHHFLGNGVYFYEGDARAARVWARRSYKGEAVAVLQSSIRWGICLSLFIRAHRMALIQIERYLLTKDDPENVTLGAAINYLAGKQISQKKPAIETVKAGEIEVSSTGVREYFVQSKMFAFSKLMICVRETSNILSRRIVYMDDDKTDN